MREPFLPQIYHKLNLLMLWWNKYNTNVNLKTKNVDELHQKSLKSINVKIYKTLVLKFNKHEHLFLRKNS